MYTLTLNLTTFLLLALAVDKLCRALAREEWAPAIFLLCAVNNVALTDYFFFYLDMDFFSLGVYSVALQVVAWRSHKSSDSIISGLGLGLLFWMKPANALIFLAVYALSEIFRGGRDLFSRKTITDRRRTFWDLLRHWKYQALGFIPVLGTALFCGGAQTILQLIQNNEINDTTTPLHVGFLLRLFYFPLCLSFFYHFLVLAVLLLAAFFIGRIFKTDENHNREYFPGHLFIPLALAYLAWGVFFSFGIQTKGMRSLLPMLPICWIALFWLMEKRRVSAGSLFLIAAAYSSLAFLQKTHDLMGTRNTYVDDTYQLTRDSWTQMPSPWLQAFSYDVNTLIGDGLTQNLPPPGIICANTIELQKELAWRLCAGDLLQGTQPRYDVRLIFNYKGDYYNRTLVGANMIVFETLGVQADTINSIQSLDLLQYGINEWATRQHCAQPGVLNSWQTEPLGYFFLFPKALTQAQINAANQSKPLSGMVQLDNDGEVPVTGPHFSRPEAWQLIKAWYEKRTAVSAGK
jgi:hypothetical protein